MTLISHNQFLNLLLKDCKAWETLPPLISSCIEFAVNSLKVNSIYCLPLSSANMLVDARSQKAQYLLSSIFDVEALTQSYRSKKLVRGKIFDNVGRSFSDPMIKFHLALERTRSCQLIEAY